MPMLGLQNLICLCVDGIEMILPSNLSEGTIPGFHFPFRASQTKSTSIELQFFVRDEGFEIYSTHHKDIDIT